MKIALYNQKGEKEKDIILPKEIFAQDFNSDLIHQVLLSMRSNRRQGTAHTKDRGEVRGGGKKPWRQKGTGRARHGSIRSPIWIGGGVTFGPRKDRNYKKTIPQKMRKTALRSVLSQKFKDKEIFILNEIKLKEIKTKELAKVLENLANKLNKKDFNNILLITNKKDSALLRASKNIKELKLMEARNLNVLDVLSHKNLLITEKSIKTIKEILGEKSKNSEANSSVNSGLSQAKPKGQSQK